MKWTPLLIHSDYSLMNSAMDCEKIAKRCKELGYDKCAITDNGSVSGLMEFAEACDDQKINSIFGIEAFVCEKPSEETEDNRNLSRVVFLAKTLRGCKALFKASSQANRNLSDDHPRLSLTEWSSFGNDWIAISGYPGSTLYNAIYRDGLLDNPEQRALEAIAEHKELFPEFRVGLFLLGKEDATHLEVVANILRVAAKKLNVECIALPDGHYTTKEDSSDHRVLLCSLLGTTLPKINAHLNSQKSKDLDIKSFFKSDSYHIPSIDEIDEAHKGFEEEIANAQKVADLCTLYSLKNNPILPEFDKNIDAYKRITDLAREGWRNLFDFKKGSNEYEEYGERIKMELSVIKENNLSNYFLIVADICKWAKENGIFMGPARGSSGGCLISYLLNITEMDPIKRDLLFERFFNPARKNSLPDIDLDFDPSKREDVFNYIINKYGKECTAKISTFGRLQGRAIIKEVLKIHEAADFQTVNAITKFIPDESKISDDLQEMKEDDSENAKILYWALTNNAKELSPWVKLENDGSYSGELGKYFAQAIRLEGIYKSIGEHASGIIITPEDIDTYCPLIMSRKGKLLAGMPYPFLEKMGLTKIDILGVSVYRKLAMIINCLEYGDIYVGDSVQNTEPIDNDEDRPDDAVPCDTEESLCSV